MNLCPVCGSLPFIEIGLGRSVSKISCLRTREKGDLEKHATVIVHSEGELDSFPLARSAWNAIKVKEAA